MSPRWNILVSGPVHWGIVNPSLLQFYQDGDLQLVTCVWLKFCPNASSSLFMTSTVCFLLCVLTGNRLTTSIVFTTVFAYANWLYWLTLTDQSCTCSRVRHFFKFQFFLVEVAFCGESFDLSFVLSYMSFLPELEEIKFVFQVRKLYLYIIMQLTFKKFKMPLACGEIFTEVNSLNCLNYSQFLFWTKKK